MLQRYWDGRRNWLQLRSGLKVQLDGEAPTSFLTALVKSRKARTGIKELVRNGVSHTDARDILEAATCHFTEAFNEVPAGVAEPSLEWLPRNTLDEAAVASLSLEWSEQEVKQALKELANDKSPGRVGFPKELFQRHWELLREPVMKMIGEFTATGKLPDVANEAVTILLYKKGAETDIKNYRPITLLPGVYKLLAKVVATRMKAVLGQVISKEQYGFLPGRRLTDAVSMVADMIEAGRNENSDWYLLLIDFEKAYDSVRRGFMVETVAKLGFPPRFVRWIEALHSDVHTRLCVNGWVGEKIEMKKGVRQGCPLAPYLFLCAVEPLCRLAEGRKLGIGEGSCDRLSYVGGKSAVLPIGRNVGQQAPDDMEYKWVGANEFERLLGVWISPGREADATWEKAFDRAAGELSKWSTKYLTTGARVTVINSYVLPIFLFQAQVYPPDDLLWRRVEKLIENFVSGNHADTERHFRLWSGDLIYTPREQGGLGVIDPRGRIDSVALRCAGLALQQECSLRRGLSEKAAGLPLGWATLYAHKAVLRGGLFKSRRWARLCKTFLKSTVVTVPEAASRWEAEEEFLYYNRCIIHRGNAPFGGQKGTERLRSWRMRDMVLRKWDGTRTLKPEATLVRELGGSKEAEMALKAFNAAPERWRQWVLAPLTAEEVAAESPVVCTRLPVVNAVKSALSMMQPARRADRLADFVFGEEETKSGFPEATMVAVALHQVWLGRCDVSLRKVKRFQARKVLRRINVEFNKHARIYCGTPRRRARKDKARWNLAEDEARVMRRICVSEVVGLKWQGGFQSIWSNPRTFVKPP
ncbi:unnamed protein product [Closterium sp. Yama58-4]|nr:unnamed protein product [Closterium sp. Yama58-4]